MSLGKLKLHVFILAVLRLKIALPNMVGSVCSRLALLSIQLMREREREREITNCAVQSKLRNILALLGSF